MPHHMFPQIASYLDKEVLDLLSEVIPALLFIKGIYMFPSFTCFLQSHWWWWWWWWGGGGGGGNGTLSHYKIQMTEVENCARG